MSKKKLLKKKNGLNKDLVVVQGLGFVGSAMAVAVASKRDKNNEPRFNVTGIDLPNIEGEKRINSINSGKFPFKTNDNMLSSELSKAVKFGNLNATTAKNILSDANVVLVSINCDLIKQNDEYKIDIDPFINSLKDVALNISENTLVIIESTVPPGTCEKIVYPLFIDVFQKRNLNINKLYLAHSYERVMPGNEYYNSIINYWRVYAGINQESSDKCEAFFSKIVNTKDYPLTCLSSTISSETSKLLENSFRAVNIAFIEEWGRFAEDIKVDLFEIIKAIRMRPTHSNLRQPGFGVGGYCLTKDPLFAKISARDILQLNDHDFPFSTKAVQVNAAMPLVTLEKIKNYFKGSLKGIKILIMGVTYKQEVGDTRFSPSETFAKEAKAQGAVISAHDTMIKYWNEMEMDVKNNLPESSNFNAILFAVPHAEYQDIILNKWIENSNILIFDANNVLTKKQISEIKENKLHYMSIGRG